MLGWSDFSLRLTGSICVLHTKFDIFVLPFNMQRKLSQRGVRCSHIIKTGVKVGLFRPKARYVKQSVQFFLHYNRRIGFYRHFTTFIGIKQKLIPDVLIDAGVMKGDDVPRVYILIDVLL